MFTQAEVAKAVGVSHQAVSKWNLPGMDAKSVVRGVIERYGTDRAVEALGNLLDIAHEKPATKADARAAEVPRLLEEVVFGDAMPDLQGHDAFRIIRLAGEFSLARKRAAAALATSASYVSRDDVADLCRAACSMVRATMGPVFIAELVELGIAESEAEFMVSERKKLMTGMIDAKLQALSGADLGEAEG